MADFLFLVIAGVTALCAIATVVTQNIVRCATWLLFTLAGVSAIFFLLAADIVGAVQLLVYVGGTLVLVVFGVMLTAQGPFITMKTSSAEWAVSATVGLLMMGVLGWGIYSLAELGPSATRPDPPTPRSSASASWAPQSGRRTSSVRGASRKPCGPTTCCRSKSSRCTCSWS
jgi:NADH-quinone oxidoreductase subunit J